MRDAIVTGRKRSIILLVTLAALAGLAASADGTPKAASKVSLYFLTSQGRTLLRVARSIQAPTPTAATRALLQGPTRSEQAKGAEAVVPKHHVRLLRISTHRGTATIALRGPSLVRLSTIPRLRVIASLTYTVTQFPSVSRARFKVDGRAWGVWSLQGTIIRNYRRSSDRHPWAPACAPHHGCFSP